jgi:hypothetical protein
MELIFFQAYDIGVLFLCKLSFKFFLIQYYESGSVIY